MTVSRSLLPPGSSRLWPTAVVGAAVVLLGHFALTLSLSDNPALLSSAGNLLSLAESAAATVALGVVGFRSFQAGGRLYLGWIFLALAVLASTLGDGAWWLIQQAQGRVPVPSPADPLYLAFYPLFVAGLVLLPAMPQTPGQRFKLGLDMGSTLLAGALLFWTFAFGPLVSSSDLSTLSLGVALAYPAGDIALFSALLLLLSRRVSPASQPALKLLAAGAAFMLLTDTLFSYQVVDDTYISGGFVDLGYTITYIFFALAAIRTLSLRPETTRPQNEAHAHRHESVQLVSWSVALPYGAMILALGLLAWDHFYPTGVEFPVLVITLGSIVLLLGARQFLAIVENNALREAQQELNERLLSARDELEARVQERTQELVRANAALEAEVGQHELAEAQLRVSLKEKEVLLKEVHHRVKNNLQVVYSLFSLQAYTAGSRSAAEILRDGQSRIRAMSLIHEKLYASPDLTAIELGDYLRSLVGHLFRTYQANPAAVLLRMDVVEAWLSIDTAVPCGLIVNELVANALSHAFPDGREGLLAVELTKAGDGRLHLSVSDNGVGLPTHLDILQAKSLGLQLAVILVRQIDGELAVDRSGGTSFYITFKP